MSDKEFSLEDSEELLRNLKSGAPSEFEQLRSALSLLAHVPEMSVAEMPPALPSGFEQPIRLVPVKSSKSRKTIVTSIFVAGLFATGSLAAAAVTGIGPAVLVNTGHSVAKFVRNVVGGAGVNSTSNLAQKSVTVGTNGTAGTNGTGNSGQNGAATLSLLGPTPSISPSTSGEDDGNQNESEHDSFILPSISSVIPPLALPTISSSNSDDNENETPAPTQTSDGKKSEDSQKKQSQDESSQGSGEDQNQSETQASGLPTPNISVQPTSEPTESPEAQASAEPSILPTILPSDTPTETPEETESPN